MEMLIDELQDIVDDAFSLPFSGGKTVVNAERLREIIEDMRTNIPADIKQAKAIASDRNTILKKSKEEAEAIVQSAEERAKEMVNQSEIVRQAQQKASEIIYAANTQADEIKKAAGTYVDKEKAEHLRTINRLSQEVKHLKNQLERFKGWYSQQTAASSAILRESIRPILMQIRKRLRKSARKNRRRKANGC